MELGENLKEHFSKITFYGLHAGNNQNSIWKPHSNFAFPEPYLIKQLHFPSYIFYKGLSIPTYNFGVPLEPGSSPHDLELLGQHSGIGMYFTCDWTSPLSTWGMYFQNSIFESSLIVILTIKFYHGTYTLNWNYKLLKV